MNNNDDEQSKAGETGTAYKTVRFFNSLDEMNEYDYRVYSKMTPEERLQDVCEMRDAYWPGEVEKRPFGRYIYIKK